MLNLYLLAISLMMMGEVMSYSTGGPKEICTNGLTPEHGVPEQSSAPPYSFSGDNVVQAGNEIALTLSGDTFLGFAIQARNSQQQPIGKFKIVESNKSQTLTCSNADDTLTHKKISKESPLNSLQFVWLAPRDYKGKVKFVGTVAKDGGTFWVGKVLKDVNVQ